MNSESKFKQIVFVIQFKQQQHKGKKKQKLNMNKYENKSNCNNCDKRKETKTYIDYEIFNGKIRLIREGQAPIVLERNAAIDIAKSENKNLVQIAYNKNDYPHAICKIIDYGKFKYDKQKKEKAAKKAAKAAIADVKEVCFSVRIDDGDFKTKVDHIKEFLSDKKTKVKITVKLSRREMNLVGLAKDLMKKVLAQCEGLAELDATPTFNNGIISCVIRPTK